MVLKCCSSVLKQCEVMDKLPTLNFKQEFSRKQEDIISKRNKTKALVCKFAQQQDCARWLVGGASHRAMFHRVPMVQSCLCSPPAAAPPPLLLCLTTEWFHLRHKVSALRSACESKPTGRQSNKPLSPFKVSTYNPRTELFVNN